MSKSKLMNKSNQPINLFQRGFPCNFWLVFKFFRRLILNKIFSWLFEISNFPTFTFQSNFVSCKNFAMYCWCWWYFVIMWIIPFQSLIYIAHCVERVRIRSFSGSYFPTFWLDAERYRAEYISIFSQNAKCGKILTRKNPNTDTYQAVTFLCL